MRALFDLDGQQTAETDVAVIGGGIVGLATAFYLARRGRAVTVLLRLGSVGAHGGGSAPAGP